MTDQTRSLKNESFGCKFLEFPFFDRIHLNKEKLHGSIEFINTILNAHYKKVNLAKFSEFVIQKRVNQFQIL